MGVDIGGVQRGRDDSGPVIKARSCAIRKQQPRGLAVVQQDQVGVQRDQLGAMRLEQSQNLVLEQAL